MLIGAHVSAAGGLSTSLTRGQEIGAEVVQIFTQSPRMWKPTLYSPEALAGYREAAALQDAVVATFCHATYLINLATPDPDLLDRSRSALVANLITASAIGAAGVVLHIGSHRGEGFDEVLDQVAAVLSAVLEEAGANAGKPPCPILLENAAGAGGTVGRTLEELAAVIGAAAASPLLGVCLDTQHLFASGISYATLDEADSFVAEFDKVIGLDRLGCIHLNDSKVALGANRDRHENLGEGLIGSDALGYLLGHPSLQGVPAILEVPGPDGKGPAARDVATAREIHRAGREKRDRAR
jgi:deoxyribonuclease-4